MRPRTRKRLAVVAGALSLLLLLAGGLLVWVLATQSGARWAFERIGGLLEGSLEARSLQGPIRGPLVVEGLVYETAELTVTVERVELRWRLRELLRKRLDVTRLAARGVRVTSTPKDTEKTREALPDLHLPVNVIVREAVVVDIVIGPRSPEPLRIDRIALATRAIGDEIQIERLEVRSPLVNADVSGTVNPQGDYPVDLELSWSGTLRGKRWAGRGSFDGTLERLMVQHELSAPVAARLSGTFTQPLRDLGFAARLEARDVLLTELDPSWPALSISGAAQARGAIESFTASGLLAARWPDGPVRAGRATFRVARAQDSWTLDGFELTVPGRPLRLAATGNVALSKPVRLDVSVKWEQLAWPLQGDSLIDSPSGSVRVEGTLAEYGLRGEAQLASARLPLGRLEIAGEGSGEALSISRLEAEALGGKIQAAGRVAWKPQLAWSLDLAAADLQPERFAREWPGELALRARIRGRNTPDGPVGRFEVTEIAGGLRGYGVTGNAAVQMRGDLWEVEAVELALGSARLQASGTVGPTVNVQASLTAAKLSDLMPDWRGSLRLQAAATGPRRAPRVEVELEASQLAAPGWSAASLTGSAAVDLAANGPLRLSLSASGLAGRGRSINTAEIEAAGSRSAHRIQARVDGEETDLTLAMRGGLSGKTWSGALTELALDSREAGKWNLDGRATLSVASSGGRLDGFCWQGARGRLCADAAWGERRLAVDATVSNLPLELAEPWLPGSVDLTGEVDGAIEAERGPDGRLVATARLEAGPGEIRYETPEGEPIARGFERARLEATAGESGAAADVTLRLAGGGTLDGSIELPRYGERGLGMKSQPLRGRVRADLPDIGWAQAFLPRIDRLAGSARGDLRISGTLGAPSVSGEAGLANGRARLGQLGINLVDISVTAKGDGGPLSITGSARSGEGLLNITGELPLAPTAERPLRVALRGRRFEAMDTAQARVIITPDLEAVVTNRLVTVTGEVSVPEAEIRYRRTFAPISASPDVIFVGGEPDDQQPAPVAAGDRQIAARVRVTLGDEVIFRGMGLEARLEGSLLVTQRPGSEPAATGELRFEEGTFRKYGQDLTIERGRILFAGPLDAPYVDLRAYRRADDGTVAGIELEGPLERPRTTLFSEPPMSETDQLAYILLGHPMGEASEQEGDLVSSAATSLGVGGGNLLAKRLGSQIGLDVTRLETEGSLEEAALVLGKYLSPRLYVEYGVGLFEAVSTLRIEYLLSKKWTLRAETGEGTSADILYTIER